MNEPFELIRDESGKVTLRRPGVEDVADVRIRRTFPWSNPGHYISIRNSEGKELLMIEDLKAIDVHQARLIEDTLSRTVFVPMIHKIEEIDLSFGRQQWKVQTSSGAREFLVSEREDVHFLDDGRLIIKDADGNSWQTPCIDRYDPISRRMLERLI